MLKKESSTYPAILLHDIVAFQILMEHVIRLQKLRVEPCAQRWEENHGPGSCG